MPTQTNKPNYQWQYVVVAVSLAFFICGSFMLCKHKGFGVENADLGSTRKITTTTTLPLRIQEVVGTEKSKGYIADITKANSTTKPYTTIASTFSQTDVTEVDESVSATQAVSSQGEQGSNASEQLEASSERESFATSEGIDG